MSKVENRCTGFSIDDGGKRDSDRTLDGPARAFSAGPFKIPRPNLKTVTYAATTQWVAAPRSAPAGTTLFAIGDVHGHARELQAISDFIDHLVERGDSSRSVVVYLGDYIDRGPEIARTLESLSSRTENRRDVEHVHLVGNHDQFLIELLACDDELDQEFLT